MFIWEYARHSNTLQILRWINVVSQSEKELHKHQLPYYEGITKLVLYENRVEKVADRGIYVNPFIGDMAKDLVEGVYKCNRWDDQNDNYEL